MHKVALDEDYTFGLVYRAYIDRHAWAYNKETEKHPYSQKLLNRGAKPTIQRELLPIILLYDEVYLEPFDNFVLTWKENELIYPIKDETKHHYFKIRTGKTRYISSEAVTQYLEKFPPETILEPIIASLKERYDIELESGQLLNILKDKIPKEYDELMNRYYELLEDYGSVVAEALAEILGIDYQKASLDETTRKAKEDELKQLEKKLRVYNACINVYSDLCERLEFCNNVGAHLKTNIPLPTNLIAHIDAGKEEFSSFIGVMVKHLNWVIPTSYSDLIRLVDDKRIADFRTYCFSALENIIEGRSAAFQVEKEFKKANDAIATINKARKIDHFIFWISLPISVLINVAAPQFGYVSTAISFVTAYNHLRSFYLKRRYKWAMVGINI